MLVVSVCFWVALSGETRDKVRRTVKVKTFSSGKQESFSVPVAAVRCVYRNGVLLHLGAFSQSPPAQSPYLVFFCICSLYFILRVVSFCTFCFFFFFCGGVICCTITVRAREITSTVTHFCAWSANTCFKAFFCYVFVKSLFVE